MSEFLIVFGYKVDKQGYNLTKESKVVVCSEEITNYDHGQKEKAKEIFKNQGRKFEKVTGSEPIGKTKKELKL